MLAPEFFPVWGGVGSYIVELLKYLPRNVEVHVITLRRQIPGMAWNASTGGEIDALVGRSVDVHYLSSSRETFFYNLPFQIQCLRHVPSLDKKFRFNVIHSHMAHMPDVFLQLLNRIHVPTVTTVHGTIQILRDSALLASSQFNDMEQGERNTTYFYPVIKILQDKYVKHISRFIAVSKITRELAIKHLGVELEKIDVVYNGVDTNIFRPPEKDELDKRSSEPSIVFIGRMIGKKGINVLVKAMPKILQSFPEARFLFVGGGNLSPYEQIIQKNGVSHRNFSFLGHLGYFERPKILRETTVFVNPSFFELCSLSILEAMSCGASVVASNVGGNPELIKSGKDGLLVPVADHQRLAEAVISLLEDENLRNKLGKEARHTVEKSFTAKRTAEETCQLYRQLQD